MLTELKNDKELQQAYVANIAMPFIDAHRIYVKGFKKRGLSQRDVHLVANAAAQYFVDLLCDNMKKGKGDGMHKYASSLCHYLNAELKRREKEESKRKKKN